MKTLETSQPFTTLKELNKEYKIIRESIMIRNGYDKNSKVKLVNAVMLWIDLGIGFMKCTSNLSDMKDKLKMYEVINKSVNFKLTAMV
ncbi:hypothetical protein [Lysinibacillus sp. BPa_S21]|uniref:hypothetical protein n=1 Tax=Lysinibacillus sp. BPa_S21 TaxID=2932478 RepID=UPI002013951F|nr:hypothetical protein [Lysinibacillus sp. BPa_S21]MCL1696284.1 hypothetical protein [Lysinibacillus sp. BPa_S21]